MSGPTVTELNEVISSSLFASGGESAQQTLYSDFSLMRGQIEQVYAVDDPNNTLESTGSVTLYDVRVWLQDGGTELIRRCRMLQPGFGGGFNNFFEVLPTDPGVSAKDFSVDSKDKRGSHVLVGFVSGQKNSGVILGTLPHPSSVAVADRPTKSEGTTLKGEFQGFSFQINNDGSLSLAFNGPRDDKGKIIGTDGPTTIAVDATGSVKIATNANQSVSIDRVAKTISINNGENNSYLMEQNGQKITLNCKDYAVNATGNATFTVTGKSTVNSKDEVIVSSDTMIKLSKGMAAPAEPFVLGKVFVQLMKDLIQALIAHQHVGNLGLPTPLSPADIPKFNKIMSSPVADESVLSKHIIGT